MAVPKDAKLKILRLPPSKNGARRKTASLGAYEYQKEVLRKRARAQRMTVSRYLNELLWKEWL
jgi:hypothetical protein